MGRVEIITCACGQVLAMKREKVGKKAFEQLKKLFTGFHQKPPCQITVEAMLEGYAWQCGACHMISGVVCKKDSPAHEAPGCCAGLPMTKTMIRTPVEDVKIRCVDPVRNDIEMIETMTETIEGK